MTLDLQPIAAQYDHLCTLSQSESQSDNQAAANGAVMHYANEMPGLLNEAKRLQDLVSLAYGILTDIEADLTHELNEINRRTAVAEWLESVRDS